MIKGRVIQLCLIAVFASLLVFAVPAKADTDYHCLNLCVSGGKPEMTCMGQCTNAGHTADPISFGSDVPPPPTPTTISNHRILAPLQPVDASQIMVTPNIVSPYQETTDYRCVAHCLQSNMQYPTCKQSCTIVTTRNGSLVLAKGAVSTQSEALERLKMQREQQAQQIQVSSPSQK